MACETEKTEPGLLAVSAGEEMAHHSFEGFTKIDSGHLDGARYDPMSRRMTIRFQNGYHYEVHDMSQEDYQAFMSADSQGEHYHSVLKPHYKIERIK
jgi:hypothetical protein